MTNTYNFKYAVGEEVIVRSASYCPQSHEKLEIIKLKGKVIWALQSQHGPAYKVNIPGHSECIWTEAEIEKLPEPSND